MAEFKILSIKVLIPDEDLFRMDDHEVTAKYGNPLPDDIALRVSRYRNIHKVLVPGTEYHLVNNVNPLPDGFFRIKSNRDENEKDIDISVSAIVGQNGSGKSTLLELLIRLLNNAAFALKDAYVGHPAMQLQFVEDVYAEMTYQLPQGNVYKLWQKGSVIGCEKEGKEQWTYNYHEKTEIVKNDAISHLLDFFFTIVLNYSCYSYNLYNYRPEWRDLPPDNNFEYTDEDRCWLSSIFHKNDAYQTPIVLNPFRSFGEIDFNNEADLTRDRLFLLSVQNVDMLSVLMEGTQTHSIIFDTKMSLQEMPNISYSSSQLLDLFIQLRNITNRSDVHTNAYKNCEKLCDLIIEAWGNIIEVDLSANINNPLLAKDVRRALNYLAYKTIKVTQNYAMYSSYRQCFILPKDSTPDNIAKILIKAKTDIPQLVKALWNDQTHITLKLHKTLAFLKFKHYQLGMGNEDGLNRHQVSAKRYNEIIEGLYQKLGGDNQDAWKREYLLPAPCFDARLILSVKKHDVNGEEKEDLMELNSLSSGQMQLLYSLSTVLYHLKNVDSNIVGGRNALNYPYINLVFDEIELYFHPNFQKDLLYDLMYAIQKMKYQGIKAINIIIATHSPYILSDFPKSNVLCLEKGAVYQDRINQTASTFAANVYDILNNRFFMDDFIGRFAVEKLEEIIEIVKEGEGISLGEYKRRLVMVELIGDVFIREKLKEELLYKLNMDEQKEMVKEKLVRIEKERKYLNSLLKGDNIE